MKRTEFASWPCSVARTVDLLGDWWTPLVLREAFLGVRRFDDMQRELGIGRNVLTQRLKRLVEEQLLERVRYQEKPDRYEYHLTEKGASLFAILVALRQWGEEHLFVEGERHSVLLDVETERPLPRLEPIGADGRPITHRNAYVRKVPRGGGGDGVASGDRERRRRARPPDPDT